MKAMGSSSLRIGAWRVDPALDQISKDGTTVKLERRATQLLLCLAEHAGQVVSVEQLLDQVWAGVVVTPDSVYHAVAALRRILGDNSHDPTYIANVPRRGYRLVAQVSPWVEAPNVPVESSPSPVAGPAPVTLAVSNKPWRRFALALCIMLAIALGYVVVDKWLSKPGTAEHPATVATKAATDKSIAVLPFADLSEKKDQEYFADGLAEEVLALLATLPELKVIGRISSFQFKAENADLRTIGTQLGVAYVVEGSVRRYGNHVRVTAQLIDTRDGVHRWSESYDSEMGDILRMQQEIAAAIARALQLEVGGVTWDAATTLRSEEAYTAFLRGQHARDRYTKAGFEEALSQFEHALTLDPSLVRAREGLALTHFLQYAFGFVPPSVGAEAARQDVDRVLRDNPRSALGHALRARLLTTYDWNWAAAEREADVALSLDSNSAGVLYAAADIGNVLGNWESAERLFRNALAIDPLDADTRAELAYTLFRAGRFAEAESEARRVLEIRPSYVQGHYLLAFIMLARGQAQAALEEMQKEAVEGGRLSGLACIYHAAGRRAESDAAAHSVENGVESEGPYNIALAHACRGEADEAFRLLDRAYLEKDYQLQYVRSEWLLRSLKHDDRYKALLRKMNLPE